MALFVNLFDVVDESTGGVVELPVRDDGRVPLSVMKPVREPRVVVRRRNGDVAEGKEVRWALEL